MTGSIVQIGAEHISQRKVVFDKGLPGFPYLNEYVFERNNTNMPFAMLKSLDNAEISFCLGDPFTFYPDYEFDLPADAITELRLNEPSDAEVWGIITYRGALIESTINLQAPVIINKRSLTGKQVILNDSRYTIRQPLFIRSDERGNSDAGIEPKER